MGIDYKQRGMTSGKGFNDCDTASVNREIEMVEHFTYWFLLYQVTMRF